MDKQQEILKAALKLFVEFGFHGTPTSKIAQEADVANGTLFHYFKTKEELIVSLYAGIKKRMTEHVFSKIAKEQPLEEILKNIYISSLYWSLDNQEEFRFIQLFNSSPFLGTISKEETEKATKTHFELIQNGIKAKILKPLPVDFIFTLISSHLYGTNQYLTANKFSAAKQKKVIRDSYELVWKMIT